MMGHYLTHILTFYFHKGYWNIKVDALLEFYMLSMYMYIMYIMYIKL